MGHILKIHLDMFANSIDDLIKFAVLNISIFFPMVATNVRCQHATHTHKQALKMPTRRNSLYVFWYQGRQEEAEAMMYEYFQNTQMVRQPPHLLVSTF